MNQHDGRPGAVRWDPAHAPRARSVGAKKERGLDLRALSPLHYALGGLVLIAAGQIHQQIPLLAAFRPALSLLALCVLVALLRPSVLRWRNLTDAWPGTAFGCLAAVWVLSALTGMSMGASASFILSMLIPVSICFLLLFVSMRSVNDVKWIAVSYIISMIIVVMLSVLFSDVYHYDGYSRRGGAGMYDGNDIGVLYMVGIPLAVTFARSRDRILRAVGLAAAIGMPMSLVLTASRGGLLGMIFGGLALLVLTPGYSAMRKMATVVGVVVVFSVAAPHGYWEQMGTILNPTEDYNFTSDTGRIEIWRRSMTYVAAYPVFGLGPNNFLRAGWFLAQTGRANPLPDQAAHNTFVQVWAELGTVGLAVWLWMIIGGMWSAWRLKIRMPKYWLNHGTDDQRFIYLLACHMPAAFIGFAITSFFVTHAYTSIMYILFAITAGLILASRNMLRAAARPPGQSRDERTRAPVSVARPTVVSGSPGAVPRPRAYGTVPSTKVGS